MKPVSTRACVIALLVALAMSASQGYTQTLLPATRALASAPAPALALPSLHDLLQPVPPARSGACTVVADAQMPLMPTFGRFSTPVIIDAQALMMLVDSGAGGSALSPRTAASLNLDVDTTQRVRLNGVGGQLDVQHPVILHSIRFGSVNLENYDVLTANIERPERENDASAPVGIVGTDLLSRFDVELDFPNHRMTLYRVSSCAGNFIPWSGHYDTFMASITAHKAFVIPVFLNGKPVRAVVDTGSNESSLSLDGARAAGVDAQTLASEPGDTFFGSKGNVVTAHRHVFQTMGVGAGTFRNARISVQDASWLDTDMLLGMDFLRWRKLWLSYSTNQVFIQYTPRLPLNRAPTPLPEAPGGAQ